MAENEWGEESGPAARKKKIPTWVWWGCGGGCLLMVLVAVAATILVGGVVKDFMDPEKAWAGVREILPYDQQPEGWDARGMSFLGTGHFILTPKEPAGCLLMVQRLRNQAELDAMFDPQSVQNTGVMGLGEIRSAETGTIRLQGREVRCLRFMAWLPAVAQQKSGDGASIRIELTGQSQVPVLVQITHGGELERVSDELVTTLLTPFDVWRGR